MSTLRESCVCAGGVTSNCTRGLVLTALSGCCFSGQYVMARLRGITTPFAFSSRVPLCGGGR